MAAATHLTGACCATGPCRLSRAMSVRASSSRTLGIIPTLQGLYPERSSETGLMSNIGNLPTRHPCLRLSLPFRRRQGKGSPVDPTLLLVSSPVYLRLLAHEEKVVLGQLKGGPALQQGEYLIHIESTEKELTYWHKQWSRYGIYLPYTDIV